MKKPKSRKAKKRYPYDDDIVDEQIRTFFDMNCDVCDCNFKTFMEAKLHYRKKHKQIGYLICCEEKFIKRFKILDHVALHLNRLT